jgi:hypothetical protein
VCPAQLAERRNVLEQAGFALAGTLTTECAFAKGEFNFWKTAIAGGQNALRTQLDTAVTAGTIVGK